MDTLLGARRQIPDHGALFAEDFDLPHHRAAMPVPEVINPTYTAAELAEARAEAWAGGHAAGTADADAAIAAATRSLLETIAAALRDARAAAAAVAERSVEPIARLLLDSLAKLFPALCERHGESEVRALVRTILPALAQEPAITVRVNPAHTPALMRELDRLDPELVECVRLVAVEAIAPGDVRVSWRDGSAIRDAAALWQQVRAVLEPAGLLSSEPAVAAEQVGAPDPAPDRARPAGPAAASDSAAAADQTAVTETASVPGRATAPTKAPVIIMETEHVD